MRNGRNKVSSVIRVARLAVVSEDTLVGHIGEIGEGGTSAPDTKDIGRLDPGRRITTWGQEGINW
jgi:hypothetical protein